MNLTMEKFQNKIMPLATYLSNNKYIKAISDGFACVLPAIIVGAIFTLLSGLPIDGYQSFIGSNGLKAVLSIPPMFTTDIIALISVFFIAYKFAEVNDESGAMPGLLALIAFLIVTPFAVLDTSGFAPVRAIPFEWLGAQGLFVAIILGLFVSKVYLFIIKKGFIIRLPKGVPPTIEKSFASLIPGFVIIIFALIINAIFASTDFGSLHALIYKFVQIPLENLGGSFGGFILAILAMNILWVFGINGTMIVINIMMPIWLSLDMANLTAFQQQLPLPNIIGVAFMGGCALLGGSGATLGLNLLMSFKSKSKRYKTLGNLSLPACICGINEPIIFGAPIILNPLMAVPFIIAPLVTSSVGYALIATNIVPAMSGAYSPLGMPVILHGLFQGSWVIALMEVALIAISVVIYYPFFKVLDKQAVEQETAISTENQ